MKELEKNELMGIDGGLGDGEEIGGNTYEMDQAVQQGMLNTLTAIGDGVNYALNIIGGATVLKYLFL